MRVPIALRNVVDPARLDSTKLVGWRSSDGCRSTYCRGIHSVLLVKETFARRATPPYMPGALDLL